MPRGPLTVAAMPNFWALAPLVGAFFFTTRARKIARPTQHCIATTQHSIMRSFRALATILCLTLAGCSGPASDSANASMASKPLENRSQDAPATIELFGLAVGMSREEVLRRFPTLGCEEQSTGLLLCQTPVKPQSELRVEMMDSAVWLVDLRGRAVPSPGELDLRWGLGVALDPIWRDQDAWRWRDASGSELFLVRHLGRPDQVVLMRGDLAQRTREEESQRLQSLLEMPLTFGSEGLTFAGVRPGMKVQSLPKKCEQIPAWDGFRCSFLLTGPDDKTLPLLIVDARSGVVTRVAFQHIPMLMAKPRPEAVARTIAKVLEANGVEATEESHSIVRLTAERTQLRYDVARDQLVLEPAEASLPSLW